MAMLTDFVLIALKNLRKRKLRSMLTLLGITISIATIFVLISVSLGLTSAIEKQFQEIGSDKFFIQVRGQFGPPGSDTAASMLTDEDVETIKKITGVKEVATWTVANTQIEFKDEIRFAQIAGISLDSPELSFATLDIEEGRFIEEGDTGEILIGAQYKEARFFTKPVAIRDKIIINEKEFRVKGILETVGNPSDDRLIYMPEEEFRNLFDIPERIDFIFVQVQENENLQTVAERTERALLKSRGLDEDTQDFTILTPEELLESFGTILSIVTSFLFGVAAISLLVGGINITNAMFTSVLERTKDIGVMKSIGAKNSDILSIFLIESGFLGLIGGIFGIVLGFAISKLIAYIAVAQLATTILQPATPFYLFVGCLLFAFVAGAVSGFWPAWKATKIHPVEALRYE